METWNTKSNDSLSSDAKYQMAFRRVKRIKGFYTHAAVYVIVNIYLILKHIDMDNFDADKFWQFHTFSTAIFWGFGLFFHGFSVFGRDFIFSNDWEQKKIKELMDKESNQKWQ